MLACCVHPSAQRTRDLRLGMTREEAIAVMGQPVGVGAEAGGEFLYYKLDEESFAKSGGYLAPYFVRLVDGRVESFGRMAGSPGATEKAKHK